jgi:deoxycytidylate deaminase
MDFNKLALETAQKSPCKKRKVGAVIVDPSGNVISTGYNYNTLEYPCEDRKGVTYSTVKHAEISAINSAGILTDLGGCTMYVTHTPCKNCQEAIDEEGLKTVVVTDFMKFDTGKLRYSLIPPVALEELAKVLGYGAKKYKANNWKNVDDKSRYVDALYRHLEAWRSGKSADSESGLSHLSHALTNIAFLIYFEDVENQLQASQD